MTRVHRLCAPLLVAGGMVTVACGQQDLGAAQRGAPPAAVPQTIEATPVISRILTSTLALPAELLPYEAVDVYAKETGFVNSIRVDRGSRVKRGDQIAELEAPELAAQRAQANAAYQSAESRLAGGQAKLAADQATYAHMREAAKVPGVLAGNDLDVAQGTAESDAANVAALQKTAEAALEALRAVAELESYLRITAPFDGQVTTRYVHPGALIGPSSGPGAMTPIVRIETLSRERLVVPVPESDVAGVAEGSAVRFTVPSFPGRTFQAPIARISREVDLKTRTMPVELDVKDPHAELVPGTFCEVEWPVRRTYPTLFVPISSVTSNLQRTFVIRIRGNRTEWVDVKAGVKAGNTIEVFGDLHEGDVVAIHGTDQLRPATEVRVKEVKPPA